MGDSRERGTEGEGSISPWRLILSPPADGARQMALDEALLEACAADPGAFRPVLRFYQFQPACLSLGRFQSMSDVDLGALHARGIDLVRRPSGGRAVLHDQCLTYALVAAVDLAPFAGGIRASALRIGEALAAGLRRLGVDVGLAPPPPRGRRPADCFAQPSAGELLGGGGKLAGSAQIRQGGAALQHGTLRLRADAGLLTGLLHAAPDASTSPASLDQLRGHTVGFDEAVEALVCGFAETFATGLVPGDFTAQELKGTDELEASRYRCEAWTFMR